MILVLAIVEYAIYLVLAKKALDLAWVFWQWLWEEVY